MQVATNDHLVADLFRFFSSSVSRHHCGLLLVHLIIMESKERKGVRHHYTIQLADLELQLNRKLEQLSVLEREHKRLADKENALRSAIYGLQGSLAVTADVLAAAAAAQTAGMSAQHAEGSLQDSMPNLPFADSANCMLGSNVHTTSSSTPYTSKSQSSAGASTAGLAASVPYKDAPALLQKLDQQESQVQEILQQMGCDTATYQQLYSTQLLRRAVSDPMQVAAHLAMTRAERLDYLAEIVPHMALLLCKYDMNIWDASSESPREQLDNLVDDLMEAFLVISLWDPPSRYLSSLMFNAKTKEFQQYPEGWWKQVMQAVGLSAEQRAALHIMWQRVKSSTTELTQQYEQLQQQLQQVHVDQLQKNRRFEMDTQQLPGLQVMQCKAEHARQVKKWQQQQHQQHQQQHQQQQQQQQREQQMQQEHEDVGRADAGRRKSSANSATMEACCSAAAAAFGAAAAATTAAAADHHVRVPRNSSSSSNCSSIGSFAVMPGTHSSRLAEAEEVLLQSGPVERQLLERDMQSCTEKLRVLHMCQALQLINTLSKKQLAVMCVHAHPFPPDALSMCEALDELGWAV